MLAANPHLQGIRFDTAEGLAQADTTFKEAGVADRCHTAVDGTLPLEMYLSDLNVLVNVGGRERTTADFEKLCADAGFRLTTVTPLPPPASLSLLEAEPVP